MDDAQPRDEVLTLLVAGHETTATALSWTFWLLSRHPDVRRRVEEEVDRKLTSHLPGAEDVEKLTWTRQVIDESLRLYPAVWGIARVAKDWDVIGGYELPPRSVLYLAQWATHRHPDFWPNPEGFDPERFAPEAAAARHRFAYFPFAGGPRVCIGNNLALLEAVLILAMVSRRYRVAGADIPWSRRPPSRRAPAMASSSPWQSAERVRWRCHQSLEMAALSPGLCCHRLELCRVLLVPRQVVGDLVPLRLRADEDVHLRSHAGVIIQRSRWNHRVPGIRGMLDPQTRQKTVMNRFAPGGA
jgi:hypothetical protein